MKKGLVEYIQDGWYYVVDLTDWKHFFKCALVVVPAVVFTIWYWVIFGLWTATEWVNKKGDKIIGDFLQK